MSVFDESAGTAQTSDDAFDAALDGATVEVTPDGILVADLDNADSTDPDSAEDGADAVVTDDAAAADAAPDGAEGPDGGGAADGAEADAETDATAADAADFDALAAYRELNPGTTASTLQDVVAEVGAYREEVAQRDAAYGRLDDILGDPATEAFIQARLQGQDPIAAAEAAGLNAVAPDPDEDPRAYAEHLANQRLAEDRRKRDQEAQAKAQRTQQQHAQRAQQLAADFLGSERLTESDRSFAQERTALLVYGSADGLNPPRPDLLMDAVLKARDFDSAVAEAKAAGIEEGKRLAAKDFPDAAKDRPARGGDGKFVPSPRGGSGGSGASAADDDFVQSLTRETLDF